MDIKIRVWDKDIPKDISPKELKNPTGKMIPWEYVKDSSYLVDCINGHYPKMLWTGFKDGSGQDIYEGDIVEFDCYSFEEPENTYEGEIVYSNSNCCFCLNGHSDAGEENYTPLCEIGGSYTTKISVLGNKYENPELLD